MMSALSNKSAFLPEFSQQQLEEALNKQNTRIICEQAIVELLNGRPIFLSELSSYCVSLATISHLSDIASLALLLQGGDNTKNIKKPVFLALSKKRCVYLAKIGIWQKLSNYDPLADDNSSNNELASTVNSIEWEIFKITEGNLQLLREICEFIRSDDEKTRNKLIQDLAATPLLLECVKLEVASNELTILEQLSVIAEITPAFLLIPGLIRTGNQILPHISLQNMQLADYMVNFYNKPMPTTYGPIALHNNQAQICQGYMFTFRAGFKEHYAIVIGKAAKNIDFARLDQLIYTIDNDKLLNTILSASKEQDDQQGIDIGDDDNSPTVRLHSCCFTGDLLRSIKCDCYPQLHLALDHISLSPEGGVLLYLNQEGRGIGISNKLRSYYLQEKCGLDTVEANEALGFNIDQRNFEIGASMLKILGFFTIQLLSNNPEKSRILSYYGIKVSRTLPHVATVSEKLRNYYIAKAKKLNHTDLYEALKAELN